jgi:IS5 family transposase
MCRRLVAVGCAAPVVRPKCCTGLDARKTEEKIEQQRALYEKLIQTTEQMVRQAERVVQALSEQAEKQAQRLRTKAEQMLPLVKRVIAQTRSRVLEGQKGASDEKVLSLFEPHTRAIPRHKGGAQVEFGREARA